MPLEQAIKRPILGVTRSATTAPIATAAAVHLTTGWLRWAVHSPPTHLVFSIWWGTSTSGWQWISECDVRWSGFSYCRSTSYSPISINLNQLGVLTILILAQHGLL